MAESRGWTLNGVEQIFCATLAEQDATPIIRATTVRAWLSQDNRVRGSRVRTRRVHPDVVREMMEEASGDA
jgi:hypothetical protein